MLTQEIVVTLRKIAHEHNGIDHDHYAKIYNVSTATIEKAVRGSHFKNVNHLCPPFRVEIRKEKEKQEARRLYAQGVPYNEIAVKLKVSKSSVSHWCQDLAAEKRLKENRPRVRVPNGQENPHPKKPRKRRTKTGKQYKARLSQQDVIDIRRAIKADGHMNLKKHAEKYGTDNACISYAARGITFREVDAIEAPITEKLPQPPRPLKNGVKRVKPDETLISTIIQMRKSDPKTWTYCAIAKWMREKTGKDYKSTHVARAMINRDPSLKDIVDEAPKKVANPSIPKPKKILTPQEAAKRIWNKRQADKKRRAALKKAIEEADAYERAVNAGLITI